MNRIHRRVALAALSGFLLAGILAAPGCSNQTETGTSVKKPAEADAGEKASMEFMKNQMKAGGKTNAGPPK